MQSKTKKSLFRQAALPVVLAMLGTPAAFAHSHDDLPRGQGTQAVGQPQPNPRATTRAGVPMPGSQLEPGAAAVQPQPVLIDGKLKTMEQALKNPERPSDEQPPVWRVRAAASAGGTQRNPVKAAAPSASHLVLVLRVTPEGGSELVSASELPGEARLSDQPKGDLIYEVTDSAETLAAEAIPDPFEGHSFGGPEDSAAGHHFHELKDSTLVVTVPNRSLRSALDRLEVRLFRLTAGPAVEKVSAATVGKLKAERRLQAVVEARSDKLGPQIRQKGRQVRE